jgi:hypothetical protein
MPPQHLACHHFAFCKQPTAACCAHCLMRLLCLHCIRLHDAFMCYESCVVMSSCSSHLLPLLLLLLLQIDAGEIEVPEA